MCTLCRSRVLNLNLACLQHCCFLFKRTLSSVLCSVLLLSILALNSAVPRTVFDEINLFTSKTPSDLGQKSLCDLSLLTSVFDGTQIAGRQALRHPGAGYFAGRRLFVGATERRFVVRPRWPRSCCCRRRHRCRSLPAPTNWTYSGGSAPGPGRAGSGLCTRAADQHASDHW